MKTDFKTAWKRYIWPALVSFVACILVFAAVWSLRLRGKLQSLELAAYDRMLALQLQPTDLRAAGKVVILGIDDVDIGWLGHYPLSDEDKAVVFERLLALHPAAIGLDIYTDVPSGEGRAHFSQIVTSNPNIVCGYLDGSGKNAPMVPPPAELAKKENQIGFVDMAFDPGGFIRRGLLYMTDQGGDALGSFSLTLANLYLNKSLDDITEFWIPRTPRFDRNDGSYVNMEDKGHQYFLDYRGPDQFPTYGLSQLFDEVLTPPQRAKLPSDYRLKAITRKDIEGKVVVVGVRSASVKDFTATPLHSNYDRYGVEQHATLVDQLIRAGSFGAQPLAVWPGPVKFTWTLGWAILGGAMAFVIRTPWRLLTLTVAGLLALVAIAAALFHHGIGAPLAPPALCWLGSSVLVGGYVVTRERADRRTLDLIFGRIVQKEVAAELWQNREDLLEHGKLRSQTLVATILFTDLRGFTAASEDLQPQQVIEWVNEYLSAMTQIVIAHRGVVEKYMGDGMMACFGAPAAGENDERRIAGDAFNAVNCALAMRAAFGGLRAKWKADGRHVDQMRVGINTGPVVAGSVGSRDHFEYATLGDTTNSASRLESYDKSMMDADIAAEGCRILIGEATCQRVCDKLLVRQIPGRIQLQGKSRTIEIHGVIGRLPPEGK